MIFGLTELNLWMWFRETEKERKENFSGLSYTQWKPIINHHKLMDKYFRFPLSRHKIHAILTHSNRIHYMNWSWFFSRLKIKQQRPDKQTFIAKYKFFYYQRNETVVCYRQLSTSIIISSYPLSLSAFTVPCSHIHRIHTTRWMVLGWVGFSFALVVWLVERLIGWTVAFGVYIYRWPLNICQFFNVEFDNNKKNTQNDGRGFLGFAPRRVYT